MTDSSGGEVTVPQPDRFHEIDGLRVVAFVFIVVGHAIAVLASMQHRTIDMAASGAILALTRFALPAFMFISSALIAAAVQRGTHVIKLRRLIIPYVAWSLVYIVVSLITTGGQGVGLLDLIAQLGRAVLTGTAYYHLWYVVLALQIAVFAPSMARALLGLRARTRWLIVAAVFLANVLLLGQVWGPLTVVLPESLLLFGAGADRNILFWSAYVVLGIAVGFDRERVFGILSRIRIPLAVAYLAAAGAVTYVTWPQAIRVAGDYAATSDISRVMQPWILPFEILSIMFWLGVCARVTRGRVAELARPIAELTFGGYLAHPLVILLATQLIFQSVLSPSPPLTIAALSICGIVGSLLLTAAVSRIDMSVGRAFTGVGGRQPSPAPSETA